MSILETMLAGVGGSLIASLVLTVLLNLLVRAF